MFRLRLAALVLTSTLFGIDFTLAKATHGQLDGVVGAAWLLSLGWLFGGAARDSIKARNGGDE